MNAPRPELIMELSITDTSTQFGLETSNLTLKIRNTGKTTISIPSQNVYLYASISLELVSNTDTIVRRYGISKKAPLELRELKPNESIELKISPFDDGPTESILPVGEYEAKVILLDLENAGVRSDLVTEFSALTSNTVQLVVLKKP